MSIATVYIQSPPNTSIKNQFEQSANQADICSFVRFFSFFLDPLFRNGDVTLRKWK
jgi:hypothetical protein